ncbi:tRNA (N(6)-L-threonylcarbamoyladenosine(37)-C(2))-methylthiotransferase MtaB [Pelagibius litoralis]|uniref:tRNA (N(6)-L-threonylcarbamoyladenosine(37)-C(2))- methylthiotransferase MtaB n=1 Tax=Pelagibius litoralis TaxID=374515 RepID=UPI002AC359EB|nr:tRNA (N(6)-L-threonylcarbamoyladenosine(37)-C(2))-methylthiotransferase MtaB [Pelagibius litoralis]
MSTDHKPRILTFGCRLNAYESEVMRGHAEAAGLDNAVIVNTCAVTGEAERQARQAIRKARRESPEAQIIVTGCAAQIDPQGFAAMAEVDRVIGNEEKLRAESFLPDNATPLLVNDIMSVTETAPQMIDGFAERTRAFVQVQQGCDHRCTFCIIPYGRGNSRSVPLGEVVRQVRNLVERDVAEVVLTGVDVTSYGGDLPGQPSLGQMLRRLLAQVPALKRLRLSSLDAIELDPDLRRLIAEEPRLMPHLHLSLQAGDDMILKRMKRRHSRAEAVALCGELRSLRPDIVFGADLIAGFPTESEAMFENSLKLIEDCGLTYLHVFPYSARKGTPAAKMPQLPLALRKERAARLRSAGAMALEQFLDSQVGKRASVLIEKQEADGRFLGRSETFAPVLLQTGEIGAVAATRITGRDGERLVAVPVQQQLSPAA